MTNIVGCGPLILAEGVNLLDVSVYAMPCVALSAASAATFGRIGRDARRLQRRGSSLSKVTVVQFLFRPVWAW